MPPRPAINGGRPVRSAWLPYAHQQIDAADERAVLKALRADRITTGAQVEAFEQELAQTVGARYGVAFSSGTAALHGAAHAAGIGPGDEAITTPLTFCATANCLVYAGAQPVFADVREDTLTIDPEQVARRIGPKTKAILPVDYAGHPADLDAIRALASRSGLLVIEDACHALGAAYRGRPVGALSDMTVFSFHPVKHITTGEGGMVVTNQARLAEALRRFRNHGIAKDAARAEQEPWHYDMQVLGWNYRLSDIACALGRTQLSRLAKNLARRREIARRYDTALRGVPGVTLPAAEEHVQPAWHLYPVRLGATVDRGWVVRALHRENIGVQVHYIPVHLHTYYRQRFGHRPGEYPVAERAYDRLVSLPLFPAMTPRDVDDVISALKKVLGAAAARTPRRRAAMVSAR